MTTPFKPKYFDPGLHPDAKVEGDSVSLRLDDETTYFYAAPTILAINVALATRRPLLLAGSPGTGKTTLAANVAGLKGWKFYQHVVTSRTKAQDLMCRDLGVDQDSPHWALLEQSLLWKRDAPPRPSTPPSTSKS
jgi:MoxR-like ATPase